MTPFDRARSALGGGARRGARGRPRRLRAEDAPLADRRPGRGADARPAAQPQARALARQADAGPARRPSTPRPLSVLAEQAAGARALGPARRCRRRRAGSRGSRGGALRRPHARGRRGPSLRALAGARAGPAAGRAVAAPQRPQPVVALRRARGPPRRAEAGRQGGRRLAQRRLHRGAARAAFAATTSTTTPSSTSCRWRCRSACARGDHPDGRQPVRRGAFRRSGRRARPGRAHPPGPRLRADGPRRAGPRRARRCSPR